MRPIIRVENLSKQYRIGASQAPYLNIRDSLVGALRSPLNWFRRNGKSDHSYIWALKDVGFEVMPGEVLGVIGRNGAGKSTLLKVLSRITEPTTGQVDLYGRVGSLLEVGTGFHSELTGRENIYLNGAILGMSRVEIQKKFDEMVTFSEIDQFLDTPVKHYSSGMFMKLAFSVAAHLDPEILIVDEVLAVGDSAFQQKCIGKMRQVATQGRTVLFVSHNMSAVKTLCTRACVMNQGRIMMIGDVTTAISNYQTMVHESSENHWCRPEEMESKSLNIQSVTAVLKGEQPEIILELEIVLKSAGRYKPSYLTIDLHEQTGGVLMQAIPTIDGYIKDDKSQHSVVVRIYLPPLIPGIYRASVAVGPHNTEILDEVTECVAFSINQSPIPNNTFPHYVNHGYIVSPSEVEYL